MRLAALLLATLVLPAAASARDRDGEDDAYAPRDGSYAPAPPPRPAPPPGYAPRPGPPPGYAQRPGPAQAYQQAPAPYQQAPAPYPQARSYPPPRPRFVAVAPFWMGWGWGWGYQSAYPRHHPDGYAPDGYPPDYAGARYDDPNRVFGRFTATASAIHTGDRFDSNSREGGMGGLSLYVDGRQAGMSASIDGLGVKDVTGPDQNGETAALAWGSAHVTWSFLAQDVFRLRLEMGASMLSMPDAGAFAGTKYAGKVAFGPDVGVSGQLGLIGPIGIEGHARVTPFPVPVVDTRIAVALRGGPLALTGGWRQVDVRGDGVDAPEIRFSGPEIGLAVAF